MARKLGFYFGSVVFFIGLLLTAAGVSNVIAVSFGIMTYVELVSGMVLIIIGFRMFRSFQR